VRFVEAWRMKKLRSELKELVMLLIFYCIQRFEVFFFGVMGIQHSSVIFNQEERAIRLEGQAGYAMLDLFFFKPYFSQHRTQILLSTPHSTREEKTKEIIQARR
jgi:hypothetical protein